MWPFQTCLNWYYIAQIGKKLFFELGGGQIWSKWKISKNKSHLFYGWHLQFYGWVQNPKFVFYHTTLHRLIFCQKKKISKVGEKFPSIFHFQLSKFSLLWEKFFKIIALLGKKLARLCIFKAKCAKYALYSEKICKFPPINIWQNINLWSIASKIMM